MFEFYVIIIALVLAVALGFITKVNSGLYALAFSFLIGSFVLGYSVKDILGMWPVQICFVLFAVNFFYNFFVLNGTMDKLAAWIMWYFRKAPQYIPFGIFAVATVIAGLGSGLYGTVAMLAPMAYAISKQTNTNPLPCQIGIMYGASTGGALFITSTGAAVRTIIADCGYEEMATAYSMYNFLGTLLLSLLYVTIAFFVFRKSFKAVNTVGMEKPEPFDKKQKQSLWLIGIMVFCLVAPYVLKSIMRDNTVVAMLAKYMDVGFLSIILSIVAILLKLGSQKAALSKVSWNVILLISGISILVSIASDLGVIDAMTNMVASTGSNVFVSVLMAFIAAVMSVFSSVNGVVIPTLYPAVSGLSAATGLSAVFLFTIIKVGASATGISPLSTAGSLSLGCAPDDETENFIFKAYCACPFIGLALVLAIIAVIAAFA